MQRSNGSILAVQRDSRGIPERHRMFPKGLGNISGIFQQAMGLRDNIEQLKQELGRERIEANAGGGMVTVIMTGKQEVLSVHIEPELLNADDPEMLETLLKAAFNEANAKVHEFVKSRMTTLTGGLDIPGITS